MQKLIGNFPDLTFSEKTPVTINTAREFPDLPSGMTLYCICDRGNGKRVFSVQNSDDVERFLIEKETAFSVEWVIGALA